MLHWLISRHCDLTPNQALFSMGCLGTFGLGAFTLGLGLIMSGGPRLMSVIYNHWCATFYTWQHQDELEQDRAPLMGDPDLPMENPGLDTSTHLKAILDAPTPEATPSLEEYEEEQSFSSESDEFMYPEASAYPPVSGAHSNFDFHEAVSLRWSYEGMDQPPRYDTLKIDLPQDSISNIQYIPNKDVMLHTYKMSIDQNGRNVAHPEVTEFVADLSSSSSSYYSLPPNIGAHDCKHIYKITPNTEDFSVSIQSLDGSYKFIKVSTTPQEISMNMPLAQSSANSLPLTTKQEEVAIDNSSIIAQAPSLTPPQPPHSYLISATTGRISETETMPLNPIPLPSEDSSYELLGFLGEILSQMS